MRLGFDFSSLEETEGLGGVFRQDGRTDDLLKLLRDNGAELARLRVWVNPYGANGEPYGAGGCDLACLLRLARRAKDMGMELLLDLHYSDFWCDPSRQCTPKAWQSMDLDELAAAVYDYTASVLDALRENGTPPSMVQTGNEITGGFLWPVGRIDFAKGQNGYSNLSKLLMSAAGAVRRHSDAEVMLHLERSGDNALYREWFDAMESYGVPFDAIGMSYYPFWHGGFDRLAANMNDMALRYGKDVWVVETAYPFTGKPYGGNEAGIRLVITEDQSMSDGSLPPFPFTKEGQREFMRTLFETVERVPNGHGAGVCYWEPAWLPLKGSTWATNAALDYVHEEGKPLGNEWANQCIFDYEGNANPALREYLKFIGR